MASVIDESGDLMADRIEEDESLVLTWKLKRTIKTLQNAKGNGTSMITLIMRPGEQISTYAKLLTNEAGTATNIKSRVNRLSVLTAITSAQQRLKLYTRVPENGLCLFVGEVLTDDGKSKKMSIDIEPHKPVNTSLYMCDSRFHVEALAELLVDESKYGFIVMDGNGCLFGTLVGSNKTVLHSFSVDLPKKHGRGGQSAPRFGRIRQEKRAAYVKMVAEKATQQFISECIPNVRAIVLAGSAEFKNDLFVSEHFNPKLKTLVIKSVDISYGGLQGFAQAIDLAADALSSVSYIHEKMLLTRFFEEIATDSGEVSYGMVDTFRALELGAVDILLVHDELETKRDDGVELLEYFANNYKSYGCKLEFVSDRSQEGTQFVKGFGGIGGLLRYKMDFVAMAPSEGDDDAADDADDFF